MEDEKFAISLVIIMLINVLCTSLGVIRFLETAFAMSHVTRIHYATTTSTSIIIPRILVLEYSNSCDVIFCQRVILKSS